MDAWDVVVVGSGPAGIVAAETLCQRGLEVLVVEAGPRHDPASPVVQPSRADWPYDDSAQPFEWLRVRAVGGGSLVWGGWCNRFPSGVFQHDLWPLSLTDLAPYYAGAERRLGSVRVPAPDRFQRAAAQLANPLTEMCSARDSGRAWNVLTSPISRSVQHDTVAVAVEPGRDGTGRLHVVSAGHERELPFRQLLLAASPIESARLLLASGYGRQVPAIGQGLTYHPVAGFALVEAPGRVDEASGGALLEAPQPGAAAARFVFELTGPVRHADLTPEIQSRVHGVPGIEPESRITFIHGFLELTPQAGRYMDLHPTRRDAAGVPVARIHLGWTEAELTAIRSMQATALDIAEAVAEDGGDLVEYLDPVGNPMLFHEAGTCAYGVAPSSPCDPWGRLRGDPCIWLADASVFPTSGDRHPTLTILAHSLRAAEALARARR